VGSLSPRSAGFAEVLGRRPLGIAAVVTDTFVRDQPGQGDDPSGSMADSLKGKSYIKLFKVI
jgi:hypothetical protein